MDEPAAPPACVSLDLGSLGRFVPLLNCVRSWPISRRSSWSRVILRGADIAGQVTHADAVGVMEQAESDPLGIGVLVGAALRQHVPDGDEQLAGDGDHRFRASQPRLQALELRFPVRVLVRRMMRCLYHRVAQVTPTGFRDAPGVAASCRCRGRPRRDRHSQRAGGQTESG